jgi:hypothetical protein
MTLPPSGDPEWLSGCDELKSYTGVFQSLRGDRRQWQRLLATRHAIFYSDPTRVNDVVSTTLESAGAG